MGLIYVNPEGPNGNPDPLARHETSARLLRRMAMNDEETVALIAGGHTFGKTHGAAPAANVGAEPRARSIEEQGLGWKNSFGTGIGADTITSGLEGTWTPTPTKWDNRYLREPVRLRVGADQEPGGRPPVEAKRRCRRGYGSRCARSTKRHAPTMLTSDIALRVDPVYEKISRRFPEESGQARRCVCPRLVQTDASRHGSDLALPGPLVPKEELIWQDPVPAVDHELIDDKDIDSAEGQRSWLPACRFRNWCTTAWASAATFRGSDKRGGANGARIRLAPQKDWEVNQPAELAKVLSKLEAIQKEFNAAQ